MEKFNAGEFIISDEFAKESKAIENCQSIILKVDEKEASRINQFYSESDILDKDKILKVAEILDKAYQECGDILAESEFIYEDFEETLGCSISEFITKLAYLKGLTEKA